MAAGVFISYRRDDTQASARHLFDDLAREFGSTQVFMDIGGSIPRGARFDEAIRAALDGCEALLALIGPAWSTCTRPDGTRRLDATDDWVRVEIATALERGIVVVPILFNNTAAPASATLPSNLHGMLRWQFSKIFDERWTEDVDKLLDDLAKVTSLRRLKAAVASAETGLRLLQKLATERRDVADAISRSREVVEGTQQQLAKLDADKCVHDALQAIERDCLRAMQAGGVAAGVRRFRARFSTEAARIQEAVSGNALNPALRGDLVDQLGAVTAAFQALVATPGAAEYQRAIAELTVLCAGLPSRLDQGMVDAAADVRFDRLIELMEHVRQQVARAGAEPDAGLQPLWDAIDALKRLRSELKQRVDEHTLLQMLDAKLRAVCEGGAADTIGAEWRRIRRTRDRLVPPFSPELAMFIDDLLALEGEIDASVENDAAQAHAFVAEYFYVVGTAFRSADQALLKLSGRLSHVSLPLKAILAVV